MVNSQRQKTETVNETKYKNILGRKAQKGRKHRYKYLLTNKDRGKGNQYALTP